MWLATTFSPSQAKLVPSLAETAHLVQGESDT